MRISSEMPQQHHDDRGPDLPVNAPRALLARAGRAAMISTAGATDLDSDHPGGPRRRRPPGGPGRRRPGPAAGGAGKGSLGAMVAVVRVRAQSPSQA